MVLYSYIIIKIGRRRRMLNKIKEFLLEIQNKDKEHFLDGFVLSEIKGEDIGVKRKIKSFDSNVILSFEKMMKEEIKKLNFDSKKHSLNKESLSDVVEEVVLSSISPIFYFLPTNLKDYNEEELCKFLNLFSSEKNDKGFLLNLDTYSCECCGEKLKLNINPIKSEVSIFGNICSFAEESREFETKIKITSGKIVFANDLRFCLKNKGLELSDFRAYAKKSGVKDPSINFFKNRKLMSEFFALKNIGYVSIENETSSISVEEDCLVAKKSNEESKNRVPELTGFWAEMFFDYSILKEWLDNKNENSTFVDLEESSFLILDIKNGEYIVTHMTETDSLIENYSIKPIK